MATFWVTFHQNLATFFVNYLAALVWSKKIAVTLWSDFSFEYAIRVLKSGQLVAVGH